MPAERSLTIALRAYDPKFLSSPYMESQTRITGKPGGGEYSLITCTIDCAKPDLKTTCDTMRDMIAEEDPVFYELDEYTKFRVTDANIAKDLNGDDAYIELTLKVPDKDLILIFPKATPQILNSPILSNN